MNYIVQSVDSNRICKLEASKNPFFAFDFSFLKMCVFGLSKKGWVGELKNQHEEKRKPDDSQNERKRKFHKSHHHTLSFHSMANSRLSTSTA